MIAKTSDAAETLIRATGERLTVARVQVLRSLLNAGCALTHQEVEERISRQLHIDRVTIYRVLEWLTRERLVHKISSDDRVWRFDAPVDSHKDHQAHFKCNCCDRVICLESTVAARSLKLPAGYVRQELHITVKGLCADCLPENPAHDPSKHRVRRSRKYSAGVR